MDKRIEVGVLGATGMVGQQFINQLAGHPWFSLTWLAASERSEGKQYSDAAPWRLETPIPAGIAERSVEACTPGRGPRLVFSALDASVAGEIEQAFADAGHFVVSNSKNHRMDPTVPLLVPEVNADHLGLLPVQEKARARQGRDRDQPELLHGRAHDGARAAQALRHPLGARDHDAGGLRRGLPRRPVARHPRQRDPLHRRRGGEDRDRDAEDPRPLRERHGRVPPGEGQRAHEPRARGRRAHRVGVDRARAEAPRPPTCARRSTASRDGRSSSACRPPRRRRSSTSTSRTGRSRASTRTAAAA